MEINITFRHADTSQTVKDRIIEKINRLGKYFIKPINAHVTLNMEGSRCTAEITMSENHSVFTVHETSHDIFNSVDRAIEKLETQLRKYKEKIKDHHHPNKRTNLADLNAG